MTVRKWSDPVRHERIIARIVECLLEARLDEAKAAWRSRVSMARAMSRELRLTCGFSSKKSVLFSPTDSALLAFFNTIAAHPITKKVMPLFPDPIADLGEHWNASISSLRCTPIPGSVEALAARLFDLLDPDEFGVARNAFKKMIENAGVYDHLTQLPEAEPKPRKAKRTLLQTRADKATEAAKLWRRRLRLAKAKLEKYTKQQKYYEKKEVKE